MILDPYGYIEPDLFVFLSDILDSDVSVIFLKRDYAEQFYSWKVRGVYHKLNQDVSMRREDIDPTLLATVNRLMSDQTEPPLHTIVLTANGQPIDCKTHQVPGERVLVYPLEDAIEDLLVLFYNDLNSLKLAKRSYRHLVVDYNEISERFSDVVRLIRSESSQLEIQTALGRPVTSRLRKLGPEFVQPTGILESFSDCLGQVLNEAVAQGTLDNIWQWRDGRGSDRTCRTGLQGAAGSP